MKVVEHYSQIDPSKCIGCHICERRCPGEAIKVGRTDGCGGYEAPCSKACPAHVNVAGYVSLVGEKRFAEAYSLIMQNNPFPSICGRICTHPCEGECNRGLADKPIAIRDLKKYVADTAYANDEPVVKALPKNGKSVGIIGAGPSGMTCAYYLALLGYEVDVYEEEPVAGGILAYGIPEYRLPKAILQKEIDHIVNTGVNMHLNCSVGKDVTMDELKTKHDAVYIATGNKFSKKMDVPGEELPGVIHGLDFLHDVNLGKEVAIGKNVVVVGGGNTAMDVSRTLVRLGAERVTVLYRRGLIDMPAEKIEIQEAMEEGVKFVPMTAPVKVLGNGKVEGIECLNTKYIETDGFGRRKVETEEGTNYVVECDMVIPAVSQYFDLPFVKKDAFETSEKGNFVTDAKTMMTSVTGIFAGGDMIRGSDVAITAIADGKNAAINIDVYLGGNGVLNVGSEIELPSKQHEDSLFKHERFPIEYLPLDERKSTFNEAVVGYTEENAVAEARRCLRCDTQYKATVDPDKCLDCGLCVEFCPQGAPKMVLRDQPIPLAIEVKEEDKPRIAEICKKARVYPAFRLCACAGVTPAEICQAILEGCTTQQALAQRLGVTTGCGGLYCTTPVNLLLEAAGYPPESTDNGLRLKNTLNLWDVSKEVADKYPMYHIEEDQKLYFHPELFDDYTILWPKKEEKK